MIRIIVTILLFVFIVSTIYIERPRQFSYAIGEASKKTRIQQFYFEIYDKSTQHNCNRLIIIKPFDWHILARFNEVFILNQSNIECNNRSTPASRIIDSDVFENVCVSSVFVEILDDYMTIVPNKIPFSVDGMQFTILEALNILGDGYLPISDKNAYVNDNIINYDNSDDKTTTKLREKRSINNPRSMKLTRSYDRRRDDRIAELNRIARKELDKLEAEKKLNKTILQ